MHKKVIVSSRKNNRKTTANNARKAKHNTDNMNPNEHE